MRRAPALLILAVLATRAAPARAGETACWFENGAVVAPAAIGGLAGDYVIDLSAPRTLLHETKAQAAGFADTALALPVEIAGQRLAPIAVTVSDLDVRGLGFRTPIAGVIGADVLAGYALRLDFAPCRLRLTRSRRGGQEGGKGGGWVLPVRMVGGLPTVPATATDGDRVLHGQFAIDTASRAGVRAAGPPAPPGKAEIPRRDQAPNVLRALSLGGRLFEHPSAVITGDLPDGVAGAIGVDVLAGFRLDLDPKAGRLRLTPFDPDPGHEKGPGVSAEP